jgi:hypothetical protein
VCLKESANFEQMFGPAPIFNNESARVQKSFVYSEKGNFCAHAACLGVDETAIVRRTVDVQEKKTLEVYILKEDNWKDLISYSDECIVCHNPGYLSAKIENYTDDIEEEPKRAHLLCALYSETLQMTSFAELKFRRLSDSNNLQTGECCFCSKDMLEGGWRCDHEECDLSCHIYCYYSARQKRMLEQKGTMNEQLDGGSQELSNNKALSRFWFRREKSSKCQIKNPSVVIDMNCDELADVTWHQINNTTLKQLGFNNRNIFEKIQELSVAEESKLMPKLGIQETFCGLHSESLSSYCHCRESKEKTLINEFDSIFCEDCGTWFHMACLNCCVSFD